MYYHDVDRHNRLQIEDEKTELDRELVETKHQLEDDVDTEIEHLRRQYEEKMTTARETTLKYKGENGIMKKKYAVLQKELEDQKEEVIVLQTRERELHDQIKVLEREVSAHKKEIKVRDTSIGEKEKRIYELKKKNQELDKFKFVLDFKIRELKKQIEPRQLEIMSMKDKIKEMDAELDKFHTLNTNLDTMIGTLRHRIDELQDETRTTRMRAKQQENSIAAFKSDIQAAVAHILSPPALKEAVERLVEIHGASGQTKPRIDPDVDQEYSRHKEVYVVLYCKSSHI
jgi:chromosome segregation ATPase